MIKTDDAIAVARGLIGTPYSEMDCIALIRAVIKKSPGGDKAYRCEGTNWLWRSIGNSEKYRHLLLRWEGIDKARAGMLAFKRNGDDVHHVGLVTDEGTVIHASSASGAVVETALDHTWDLLGWHAHIEIGDLVFESEDDGPAWEVSTVLINQVNGLAIRIGGDWRVAED